MKKTVLLLFVLLFPVEAHAFGKLGMEFGAAGINKAVKIVYVYLIGADGKNLLGADSFQLLGVGK
jgi:hypothetical protein